MAIAEAVMAVNKYCPADTLDGVNQVRNYLTTIQTMYDWEKYEITGDVVIKAMQTGKFYISDTTYLQIIAQNGSRNYTTYGLIFSLVTPNGTKEIMGNREYNYASLFAGKTSNGLALGLYSSESDNCPTNARTFNVYVGEFTKLDGTILKGFIYTADNGTLTIATDDGISSEIAQTSTINADRTAILAPVVDTTYGNVFKDIYFMRSSPLNCNIMAVEGQGNFLCGKTLCLKDQEVGV